ncbi:HNH endonuclease [Aeromonas phage BUCT695]|uniref:HNH endonuclease n=1 Tax=Aeromonas phage BUCT695 TaxID=2908630 RepID=UPI0023297235|nr:HNH endonuclease [Aeromonas phage BUCT695]UIW10544.1 HNH endonuclease [Aeromonas phage BUCT695]
MPSSPGYVRNYKQERLTAIQRGETGVGSSSKDAIRHRARRLVEKKLGHKLPSTKHVDHIRPLKSSKSNPNTTGNLRVRDAHSNTSAGGKMGSSKGKAAGARKGHKSRRLPVKKPS